MLKLRNLFLLLFLTPSLLFAQQSNIIDQIVATVGGSVILQSDIENQYIQMMQQQPSKQSDKCAIFEELLIQKLLLNQARVDSIEVNDSQVETQLDNRIKFFIDRIGSQEKLEKYFNKSIYDIKDELRGVIKEQMITQKMQNEIIGSTKVTPTEVKEYFESLPADSIPQISPSVEIAQIVKHPAYTESSIYEVKQKLLSLRKRIIDGEKFSTLAILYSEDKGSAVQGGEVGFSSKGELDPEYAKVAFSLKEGGVSTIVESQFGFHIIQLIERKDDRVNTRHILLKPKATDKEIVAAVGTLDSIANMLKKDSIKFNDAAYLFSDDKNSRLNHGLVINPSTGSSAFELSELGPADYYTIKTMQVGDISKPYESVDENGKQVYKIVKLISKTKPHKANLKDDYQILQEKTIENKRKSILENWIAEKRKTTFLRFNESVKTCDFLKKGWIK